MTVLPVGFAGRVVRWQRAHGRNTLPWQSTRDPYRVWLSEVMLQQAQVATVLDYYTRFLERFPDVHALASAPEDEVFAMWSGLGYYSRARNLHRCAKEIIALHGGVFPGSAAQLQSLPGIGRSTAAAIASFCFGERVAILDGNVKRVLTRVLAFDADLSDASAQRDLWGEATRLLPETDIEAYTQGLMDLGATVCLARSPHCLICPAAASCAAALRGDPERYPVKGKRARRGTREHVWLWLRWQERLWLVRRPDQGVWAGLWSLPEFDSPATFDIATARWPGRPEALESFTHVLTHLDWTLHPQRWTLPDELPSPMVAAVTGTLPDGRWFTLDEALAFGLPAPLRRLLSA